MLPHVTIVRQVLLRWKGGESVYEIPVGPNVDVQTVCIPGFQGVSGEFGQIVLRHQPGDVTVSGLPVYRSSHRD